MATFICFAVVLTECCSKATDNAFVCSSAPLRPSSEMNDEMDVVVEDMCDDDEVLMVAGQMENVAMNEKLEADTVHTRTPIRKVGTFE